MFRGYSCIKYNNPQITRKITHSRLIFNAAFLVVLIFYILSATSCDLVSSKKKNRHNLSKSDTEFFDSLLTSMSDIGVEMTMLEENNHLGKIEAASKFASYLKSREGHVFDSGAVFTSGSSMHLFIMKNIIHEYDNAGDCEKTYDLLKEFTGMIYKDYLIVDYIGEKVYDPEIDRGVYKKEKYDNIEFLTSGFKYLSCYDCEIKPDADWHPEEKCLPVEEKFNLVE